MSLPQAPDNDQKLQDLAGLLRKGYVLCREKNDLYLQNPKDQPPRTIDDLTDLWNQPKETDVTSDQAHATAPLTPQQEHLFKRSPQPIVILEYQIRGPLQVQVLEQTLQDLTRQQPILRTIFPIRQGQRSMGTLSHVPQRLIVIESSEPIPVQTFTDLERTPPWRAVLIRHTTEEHKLRFTFHAALVDPGSMAILAGHIKRCLCKGTPEKEQTSSFNSFSRWFHRHWMGLRLGVGLAGMNYQLEGYSDKPVLPVDQPTLSIQTFNEGRIEVPWQEEHHAALQALEKNTGYSKQTILTTLWLSLMTRFSGETDQALCLPFFHRDLPSWNNQIGNFENTVLMRAQLQNHIPFTQALRIVYQTYQRTRLLSHVPLSSLAEQLLGVGNSSVRPFRVGFAFYPAPKPFKVNGLEITPQIKNVPTYGRDINLQLFKGNPLSGYITYNTNRFTRDSAQALADYMLNMLLAVAGNDQTPIQHLPLTNKRTRRLLLQSQTAPVSMHTQTGLHQKVFEQAKRTPNTPALHIVNDPVLGNMKLEYGLLADWSHQVAAALQDKGVEPGDAVGLFMYGYADAIAVMLGILAAGATVVPLDPSLPNQRIARLTRRINLKLVITRTSLRERIHDLVPELPCLCADEGDSLTSDHPPKSVDIGTQESAFIMFTSGSTGTPKGVPFSHGNICDLIHSLKVLDLGPDQTVLQQSSLGFDAALFEIFGCLSHGGTLVLPGEHTLDHLPDLIRKTRITTLWLTSHLFRFMVDEHLEEMADLHQLITGGDVLPPLHVARFLEAHPNTQLYNGYGPTECTTFATLCNLSKEGLTAHGAPIGRSLPGTAAYILDTALKPVPVGIRGQIFLAGDGLTQGYLNQPRLTAQRFSPNPYASQPGSRLYKTGDIARLLPSGAIEFLGRADHQIKVRNFRVEPKEVEQALEEHPQIKQALVLPRTNAKGSRSLVAYVVVSEGKRPTDSDDNITTWVREFANHRLPQEMMPNAFIFMDSLPLNPAGKVDIKLLPNPLQPQQKGFPKDPVQTRLASLFAEAGGTQLETQFRDAVGVAHSPKHLLERLCEEMDDEAIRDCSPAQLAQRLARESNIPAREGPDPQNLPSQTDLLSVEQQRYLAVWRSGLKEGHIAAAGNIALSIHIHGDLDRDKLQSSLQQVAMRHTILRTWFPDQYTAQIQQDFEVQLQYLDLSGEDMLTSNTRSTQLMLEKSRTIFDLQKEPPWLAFLVKRHQNDHQLMLLAHRVIADEASLLLILNELSQGYRQGEHAFPEPDFQYHHYAAWQKQWLKGDRANGQKGYWQQRLKNTPVVMPMPTDFPYPAKRDFRINHSFLPFRETLANRLQDLGNQWGSPLGLICQAAFASLLARMMDQHEIILGWRVANRARPSLETMMGPVANILPLRLDLQGNPRFWEILERVRRSAREARQNQALPFAEISAQAWPKAPETQLPICQIIFGWDLQLQPQRLEQQTWHPNWLPNGTALCDLYLHITQTKSSLQGHLLYATQCYRSSTAQHIGDRFMGILETLVEQPAIRLLDLPLQTKDEREGMLRLWNSSNIAQPNDRLVHQLIEDQASRHPHELAIKGQSMQLAALGGGLTFKKLNGLANRLARRMRSHGIGLETPVAIALSKPIDRAIALLACLKAGVTLSPISATHRILLKDHALEANQITAAMGSLLEDKETPDSNLDLDLRPNNAVLCHHNGMISDHHSLSNNVFWLRQYLHDSPTLLDPQLPDSAMLVADLAVLSIGQTLYPHTQTELDVGSFQTEEIKQVVLLRKSLRRLSYQWREEPIELANLKSLVVVEETPPVPNPLSHRFINHLNPTALTSWLHLPYTSLGVFSKIDEQLIIAAPPDNLQFYVLAQDLSPCATGIDGQLYIAGPTVPRCLHNQPQQTALIIVPNHFVKKKNGLKPGSSMIATGLRARFVSRGEKNQLGLQIKGLMSDHLQSSRYPLDLSRVHDLFLELEDVHTVKVSKKQGEDTVFAEVTPQKGVAVQPLLTKLKRHAEIHLSHWLRPQIKISL